MPESSLLYHAAGWKWSSKKSHLLERSKTFEVSVEMFHFFLPQPTFQLCGTLLNVWKMHLDQIAQPGRFGSWEALLFQMFNVLKIVNLLRFGNLCQFFFKKIMKYNGGLVKTSQNFVSFSQVVAKNSCAVLYLYACPPHQWLYIPLLLNSCAYLYVFCALIKATWS